MACERCAIKFTLFKRKKQCIDCLRYFCTKCVIRRVNGLLCCDNCCTLSRRPVIRSQVLQIRSRDLRQYLVAKKISTRGCLEKEDLVNLLMQLANENDGRTSSDRTESTTETLISSDRSSFAANSPIRRSRSPPNNSNRQSDENTEFVNEVPSSRNINDIEIEEISDNESSPNAGPEPLVNEEDEEDSSEMSNERHSDMFTELPVNTGFVKLSDINDPSELESLSIKQLKDLLNINRVDFKGCVERRELIDKASRLWKQHQTSREGADSLTEDSLCKICLDAPVECVMLECGHIACCINCGKQMSECPICRQYVVRVVRFFKA